MNKPKARRQDYVYIRVFATILVVIGHCWFVDSQYGFDESRLPGMDTPYYLDLLCRFIYTFHMPLFFALSGALMVQNRGGINNISTIQFVKKKARRLLLPFLVVTTFYCIPIRYAVGVYKAETPILYVIQEQFVTLEETHLWFLPCLFFCFLFMFLIQKMRKKYNYIYLLLITLGIHLSFIAIHSIPVPNWFMFRRSFLYMFPFVLGYIVSEYGITNIISRKSWFKYLIITIFVLLEIYYLCAAPIFGIIYRELISFFSVLLFFTLAWDLLNYKISSIVSRIINYLDAHSFEIFLYHAPINFIILRVCELNGGWIYPNWIFFWLRFVLTLSGALFLSHILRINFGQR